MRLVVVSGGVSEPSSTRMLADRLAARARELAAARGITVTTALIELRPLAADIAAAQVTGFPAGALAAAVDELAGADALVVATPVYSAGVSGLVKSFLDVVDPDLLIGVPTLLAATAGTSRHALVADEALRSLFAYLRALVTPTSVFAGPEDWGSASLGDRVDRAAHELVVLAAAGVRDEMRDGGGRYARVFGSAAAGGEVIALDTDLMRLAAGGGSAAGTAPGGAHR